MSEDEPKPSALEEWRRPLVLLALTFLSTFYVGAGMRFIGKRLDFKTLTKIYEPGDVDIYAYWLDNPDAFAAGWTFAVPLMAILIAHEMGHYVAGKIHGVDISPPYFIPMPIFLLGTMGAVIRMRGRIETRNALLDIGAAGPLAGMVVAIPVLLYGLAISRVAVTPLHGDVFIEGRSVLYLGMLWLTKGTIPAGYDIWLSPTAMAGWAGLLVTQINLIPVGQLDGGHVAYALFGEKQDTYSRWVHRALPVVGVIVSLAYVVPAVLDGEVGDQLMGEAMAGMHWIVWALVLAGLLRFSGAEHPPTGPAPLSTGRKAVAIGTLLLFLLLFMPSWIYVP